MNSELEYHALTVSVYNGTSYWNKHQKDIESVYAHIKRYCHRHCHVFIFTKENSDSELRFKEQFENRKAKPEVEPQPTYTIWFRDGGGRQEGLTEDQMRKQSERYSFDADEVVESGELTFIDELGEEIGGCFKTN